MHLLTNSVYDLYDLWRHRDKLGSHLLFKTIEYRRLKKFKNLHQGVKRCFVIGNGPSIKQQNLTLLRNEYTFATNFFVLHEDFEEINLKYLCLSNPKFWRKGTLPSSVLQVLHEHPELITFFEHTFLAVNQRQRLLDRKRCYYVYLDYKHPVFEGHVSLDPARRTHHGHTVIIDLCLPLAYYMGFEEVYLLGCDCDYGLDEAPDYSKAYFYPIQEQEAAPDSASYLTDRWVRNVFNSYSTIKKTFETHDRKIYNATHGGKLEVFPRVNFEDVLGLNRGSNDEGTEWKK